MWSAAVFDPALPGRRRIANGSPVPGAPWSTNAHNGWNPKPFLFSALGRSGLRGGHQLAVLCRGSTGDLGEGWQAEVGRGCFQLFDLVELLACSDEADLQAVDLAEPAQLQRLIEIRDNLIAGIAEARSEGWLGDPGDEVVADLDEALELGGLGAYE